MVRHLLVGHGLLIIEASRSHSDTPQSIRLIWTSDQPDTHNSTWQHSQEKHIHDASGIRTRNPSKRAAADPCLRLRGCWNRRYVCILSLMVLSIVFSIKN